MDSDRYVPVREVPELDAMVLRAMTTTPELGDLPKEVEDAYWGLKRCCDRAGVRHLPSDLAMLCYQLGYGHPTPKESEPTSVVELWKSKKLTFDDPVQVKWRNRWRSALIKGITGADKVLVWMEEDGTDREVDPNQVRLADLVVA